MLKQLKKLAMTSVLLIIVSLLGGCGLTSTQRGSQPTQTLAVTSSKLAVTSSESAVTSSESAVTPSESQITVTIPSETIKRVIIPSKNKTISAGWEFAINLKSDGSVLTWGSNFFGQLGNGTVVQDIDKYGKSLPGSQIPEQIIDSGTVCVEAGTSHAFAIKTDGSLWAWGYNGMGQVGIGKDFNYTTPTQIIANGVIDVSAGSAHTVALMSDGSVWTWGLNNYGQLGDGTTTSNFLPKKVISNGVVAIAAGSFSTFAIKSDGSLWVWGCNTFGELGDGSTNEIHEPKKIIANEVVSVSSNGGDIEAYTACVKTDGSLWVWGNNRKGSIPKQVLANGVTDVAIGWRSTYTDITPVLFAIKTDGSLWGWNYSNDPLETVEPTRIFESDVIEVSAGDAFVVVTKSDGSLWTWGENSMGQLGDGTTTDSKTPKQIN